MSIKFWYLIIGAIGCVLSIALFPNALHAQEIDFNQQYEYGKVLLQRKLFAEAQKELFEAITKTARGRQHFGAHYYLAFALLRMGEIIRAVSIIERAKNLAQQQVRNKIIMQRRLKLLSKLEREISESFGVLRIIPEIATQDLERLRLNLTPQQSFTQDAQQRVFRQIAHQLAKQGIALKGQPIYLPKGQYQISIAEPQCLRYGLTIGGTVMRAIDITSRAASLALQAKPSCNCEGGRVLSGSGKNVHCACPRGREWDPTHSRCIVVKVVDQRPWIAKNWPWLTAIGVTAIAAGVIIPVALNEAQNREREIVLQGKLFTK